MQGARRVGRRHRVLQRERVESAALVGKRLHIAEAEGDQRAACRRRRIERDGRALVLPEDRRPPRHAILGKIVMGEIAAAVVLLPDDGLSDIAVEEEPRAILREPFDGLGKIGVARMSRRL